MPKRDPSGSSEAVTQTASDPKLPSVPKSRRQRQACLVIIYGTELGRRVPLTVAGFTIGRSPKNDLFIDQESVSRHHAKLGLDGDVYKVADLGSKNGTYVNDVLVRGEQALKHGDQIKIGGSILKLIETDDIEANYHEEIYRLMTVDGLTQIYNKRYFTEALEREWSRRVRYKRELSLVMFDIDHFKKKNDDFGHLAGDAILRQLASVVRSNVREQDIVARVGGEEFAILLPEVGATGARTAAEKVRRVVETATFSFEDAKIPCTISLGSAGSVGKADASAMYSSADAALYRAKAEGRNRVCGEE